MKDRILVIAELGINHNGDLDLARQLIQAAHQAGADVVKFQKRTVADVYTAEELARPRVSPFGTTNADLKYGLEFEAAEYEQIDAECRRLGMAWTASCWDARSVGFIASYQPPFLKIPSACVTDLSLLSAYHETGLPLMMSCGMSSHEEITRAYFVFSRPMGRPPFTLLHCCSAYPAPLESLNLSAIASLKKEFGCPVGYSSHSVSPWPALCAAAMGATVIEAHLTLDRTLFGTDQAASLEPPAFTKLVQEIRDLERAWGDGVIQCQPCEEPVKEKLRKVHA